MRTKINRPIPARLAAMGWHRHLHLTISRRYENPTKQRSKAKKKARSSSFSENRKRKSMSSFGMTTPTSYRLTSGHRGKRGSAGPGPAAQPAAAQDPGVVRRADVAQTTEIQIQRKCNVREIKASVRRIAPAARDGVQGASSAGSHHRADAGIAGGHARTDRHDGQRIPEPGSRNHLRRTAKR